MIESNFVITAAHCVEGGDFTSPSGLRVSSFCSILFMSSMILCRDTRLNCNKS